LFNPIANSQTPTNQSVPSGNNTNQVTHIPIRAIPYQYSKFIMYHYEYPTINPRSMRQFGSRPFTQQQRYDVPMQVRMDVSNFHDERDPYAFQDWLIALEDYLEWIGLSPDRKVRFVKMKLKGQARVWWQREEEYLHRLRLPPISEWEEMKFKLQEEYGADHYTQPQRMDAIWHRYVFQTQPSHKPPPLLCKNNPKFWPPIPLSSQPKSPQQLVKPKTIPIVAPPISIHGTQTNKSTPVKVSSHPHYTKPPTQETLITHTQYAATTVVHKPIDTKIQPPSQPITPQLQKKEPSCNRCPYPSHHRGTTKLPIFQSFHHPQSKQINLIYIQTEQETQSENPNLLENPVAIPIALIQSTTTAIQKSSKNRLQLPPLPKITTTAHSTTAILTHSQFILPQIPQNLVPTKPILLENPANHSPQAVILVSQAVSSVSSANPMPPFKLPAPLSKSWPTKMRRISFVCYVWFRKRKKKKIKEIDLGKGLFAGYIRKRCFLKKKKKRCFATMKACASFSTYAQANVSSKSLKYFQDLRNQV
jgi:hypothetical protein